MPGIKRKIIAPAIMLLSAASVAAPAVLLTATSAPAAVVAAHAAPGKHPNYVYDD